MDKNGHFPWLCWCLPELTTTGNSEKVSLEEQFSGPFAVSLGMLTPLRGEAQDLSCRGNQVETQKTKVELQGAHRCIHCIDRKSVV